MPRGHRHHHGGGTASSDAMLAVATCTLTFILGYVLLEKKKLPKALWRPLSRFYFYPLMLPNLLFRKLCMRQSYFSDVDAGLVLGAVPMMIAGHVKELHSDGVRAVVNLQCEYSGPQAAYAALHPPIEQCWIPVVDHTEPSVEQLEQAVRFIAAHRARGERVLVHCKGGHGRSAAVAMAWLMSEGGGGLSPSEAQRRLSSIRHVRSSLDKQPGLLELHRRVQARRAANAHS